MLRFFSVLAAYFLFLVGTAMPPLIHASDDPIDKSTPGPAAQADGPAGKTASKSSARSNPVSPEELDETLEQAKKDNEGVATWLKNVREGHANIKELIKKYEIGDTKTERLVLAKIREQVAALGRAADGLLRRGPNFEKDLELYEASLKKAEATYQRLAGLYQRKAVDSKNPRYQKLYRQMSDSASASARVMGDNRKGIDHTRANAHRLLTEVTESREVLRDLSGYLDVGVEADRLAASIEEFYNDIKAYNQELDQTVKNIADWLQRQENTSGDPPARNSKPAA
jgi:chromosome segregation ATPase